MYIDMLGKLKYNTANYKINMVKMHTLAGLAATAAVYACLIFILAFIKAMWDYKIVAKNTS